MADAIDLHFTSVSSMRRQKCFIYAHHLARWIDRLNLSIDEVLDVSLAKPCKEEKPPPKKDNISEQVKQSENGQAIKQAIHLPEYIEKTIQKALLVSGSIDPKIRKTFFLGFLLQELGLCHLQYKQEEDKCFFLYQENMFHYSLEHLDFSFDL